MQGKWLTVRDAPKASLILWENLATTKIQRLMRILAIALISGMLIMMSFGFMIGMKHIQRSLNNSYNVSSCPAVTITKEEAYQDRLLPEEERQGLMH